ncbi:hypothetical protein DPEC_G00050570 [Dallia pectoralis]|uniref:Uncharacterized protein n=1 Tax=Dallia pectoralis TaxID=75939 RepID=A0ACC2HBD4_DALPE|nr:hypothetical protein DPEC_G00050570 [Dallia pectoralis]
MNSLHSTQTAWSQCVPASSSDQLAQHGKLCVWNIKKTNEDGNDSDLSIGPETNKKEEDLTYATIDHVNTQTTRVIVETG